MVEMRSKFRSLKLLGGMALIVLAILAADPRSMWDAITSVDLGILSLVVALYILNLIMKSYRWGILMNGNGPVGRPPFRSIFANFAFAQAINNVTPGRVFGEATRIYGASSRLGVRAGVGTALVVTEKMMDLIIATTAAVFGMMLLAPVILGTVRNEINGAILFAVLFNLLLIGLLARPRSLLTAGNILINIIDRTFPGKLGNRLTGKLSCFLDSFVASVAAGSDRTKRRTMAGAATLTVIIWANEALRTCLILLALGAPLNVPAALVVTGVSALSAVLLVAGSSHIVISSAVFSAVGIEARVAAGAGLLSAMTSIWLSVPIGLLATFFEDRHITAGVVNEAPQSASPIGKGDN